MHASLLGKKRSGQKTCTLFPTQCNSRFNPRRVGRTGRWLNQDEPAFIFFYSQVPETQGDNDDKNVGITRRTQSVTKKKGNHLWRQHGSLVSIYYQSLGFFVFFFFLNHSFSLPRSSFSFRMRVRFLSFCLAECVLKMTLYCLLYAVDYVKKAYISSASRYTVRTIFEMLRFKIELTARILYT